MWFSTYFHTHTHGHTHVHTHAHGQASLTSPSSCEGFCSTCDRQPSSDLFGQHVVSQSSSIKPYSPPAGTGHGTGEVTFESLWPCALVKQLDKMMALL